MSSEKTHHLQPTCTVVICTRNRPKELNRCLQAISRLDYPRFNVLIVDNAPNDGQAKNIALQWDAAYALVPVPGLSRARNRGAFAASGEIIAYLDDDSIPEPDWLSNLVREFADPQVMSVTGRIVALSVETEAERLWAQIGVSSNGRGRHAVDSSVPIWFELANFGGIGDGGNMAFRRQVFNEWPGFDERIGCGSGLGACEEHNAFFQLIDRGFRVIYTPSAIVRHPHPKNIEDVRARLQNALSAATAYFTLLLFEEPRYRKAVMKYVMEALQGTPRTWRGPSPGERPRVLSRWQAALAVLSGPLRYLQLRYMRGLPNRAPLLNTSRAKKRAEAAVRSDLVSSSPARSSSPES